MCSPESGAVAEILKRPLSILLGVLLLQCAATMSAVAADKPVGTFNGVQLSAAEAQSALQGLAPQARTKITSSQDNLKRFVRLELLRKKLVADALAKGVDRKPEVAAAIARARDNILVQSYLDSLAQPASSYPSEEEIKHFYYANEGQFLVPKRVHVAHIFLWSPDDATAAESDAVKKKAEHLVEQIKSGKDFAELAKANSDEKAVAARGGDEGWVFENQLLPEIQAAIDALANDGVSAPVRTHGGWHILKLLGVQAPVMQPLSAVRQFAIARLRQSKARENAAIYENGLLKDTPPQIDADALSALQTSAH